MDRIPMPLLIALVFLLALVVVLGCSDRGRRTRLEGSAAALGLPVHHRSELARRLAPLPPGAALPASAWPELAAEPGARLHLYGKQQVRPGRKMGHVNRVTPRKE